ncbi:hypothetical protein ACWD5R_37875 [Streptomyces sp. NPDC002514]|uniref:hypothetical protein n=1 Tax=Streptomyces sp. NPDC001270 TaxID=3364554 RepID=UPI0036C5C93C
MTVDERQQLGKRLQENQHQRLWQPDVNTAAAQAPAPDPTMVKKSTDITERSGILREYLTSPIVSVHVFLEKKPDANVTRRAFGDWVKNRSHDLTEQEENTLLGKLERDSFLQSKTVFKIKEKRADQSTEDSRGGFMRGGPAASGSVQANLYPPDPQGQPGVLGTEAVATFAAAPAQSPYARNPNDPNTLASTSADAQDTLRPIGSAYAYNPSSGPLPSISAYAQNTLPPIGSAYAYNPSSGPLPSISRQSAAQAQQPPGTAQGGPRR